MPYIHRFDIYHADGVNYFIGATIATTKQDKNDWSVPGRIYTGILPEDPSQGIELSILQMDYIEIMDTGTQKRMEKM